MTMRARIVDLALGTDPKLRRMLRYWAATATLYALFVALLAVQSAAGMVPVAGLLGLGLYATLGGSMFYVLVRASARLGLRAHTLAALQGLFGITCNMWAYSITGPLRGATLMGLMVVVVFCTFALRPHQTLLLALCGLLGMGIMMWWHQLTDPLHYPPRVEAVTFAIMAGCSLTVTFLTGEMNKLRAHLKAKRANLEAALETIRVLATTDELTAGDAVLRAVAHHLRAGLRPGDALARWGGEEFLLLLPETGIDAAHALVDYLRAAMAGLAVPGLEADVRISFSAGVAARHGQEAFSDAINRADKALYRAKADGRDRIRVA